MHELRGSPFLEEPYRHNSLTQLMSIARYTISNVKQVRISVPLDSVSKAWKLISKPLYDSRANQLSKFEWRKLIHKFSPFRSQLDYICTLLFFYFNLITNLSCFSHFLWFNYSRHILLVSLHLFYQSQRKQSNLKITSVCSRVSNIVLTSVASTRILSVQEHDKPICSPTKGWSLHLLGPFQNQ